MLHFESTQPRRFSRAFTIIETIVVMIIIALVLIIVLPHFLIVHKQGQASRVRKDLDALNTAVEHYALDTGKVSGVQPAFSDIRKYLDPNTDAYKNNGRDALGDAYGPFTVGARPPVPPHTAAALSNVTDPEFWSPYAPPQAPNPRPLLR